VLCGWCSEGRHYYLLMFYTYNKLYHLVYMIYISALFKFGSIFIAFIFHRWYMFGVGPRCWLIYVVHGVYVME
jgi:hypothetical protein